jgi:hypothetical protein
MKARPTNFISGVSYELGSFRDAVQREGVIKGCYPHNQPGFPPDYRSVEAMLLRNPSSQFKKRQVTFASCFNDSKSKAVDLL